jgi:hypothetical protein
MLEVDGKHRSWDTDDFLQININEIKFTARLKYMKPRWNDQLCIKQLLSLQRFIFLASGKWQTEIALPEICPVVAY